MTEPNQLQPDAPQPVQLPGAGIRPLEYFPNPAPTKRPAPVTIVSWLAIVVGANAIFGVLGIAAFLLFQDLLMGIMFSVPQGAMPMNRDDFVHIMKISAMIQSFAGLAGIFAVLGGVWTLQLREKGRKTLIGYSIFFMLDSIMTGVITKIFLQPIMIHMNANLPASANVNVSDVSTVVWITMYELMALSILFYLTRPHVKAVFAEAESLRKQQKDSGVQNWGSGQGNHIPPIQ